VQPARTRYSAEGLVAVSNFTAEQREAIFSQGPVVLIAGAGSGKTTVLVERYLRLLDDNWDADRILLVTFTNEAAEQLKDRILARLEENPEQRKSVERSSRIGTIHSFCYRLLNQYGNHLTLPSIQGILSPFEFFAEFERGFRTWIEGLDPDALRRLLAEISHRELKTLVRVLYSNRFTLKKTIPLLTSDNVFLKELWEVSASLRNRLEENFLSRGVYSFDDLENYALEILEKDDIREKLREDIRYLLVDEFQDTSPKQWDILSRLLDARREKLFVVGDPKQSIYRFRNADVKLFARVAKEVGNALELTQNFRSSTALLHSINELSGPLFLNAEIPFKAMTAACPEENSGKLECIRYETGEKRSSFHKQEIAAVVERVKHHILQTGESPSEFALLFRVSDRMLEYAAALENQGIRVTTKKTGNLFDNYEVLYLSSFLFALANPLDDYRLAAFFRSPYIGLSHEELLKICNTPGESLFEKAMGSHPKLNWFYELAERGETDLECCLEVLFTKSIHWPKSWEPCLEFLAPLLRQNRKTIFEACENIGTWQSEDMLYQSPEPGSEGVRLMTVHAAKGLEFSHVYLVDVLRQSPKRPQKLYCPSDEAPAILLGEPSPSYQRLSELAQKEEQEEAKRVLYVALTRAKKTLTLFLPKDGHVIAKSGAGSWAQMLIDSLKGFTYV
jgi:ATP-dependent helicase/nuclease subunit A